MTQSTQSVSPLRQRMIDDMDLHSVALIVSWETDASVMQLIRR